jgi:hypothetical protein
LGRFAQASGKRSGRASNHIAADNGAAKAAEAQIETMEKRQREGVLRNKAAEQRISDEMNKDN